MQPTPGFCGGSREPRRPRTCHLLAGADGSPGWAARQGSQIPAGLCARSAATIGFSGPGQYRAPRTPDSVMPALRHVPRPQPSVAVEAALGPPAADAGEAMAAEMRAEVAR
jgi:hypothetical protein